MSTTRFAPSPTGQLHLGHAFAALTAAAAGDRYLLRIEDIDRARARPEFEAAIFEDLRWLELAWEEPVLRQSERFPIYAKALETLSARGVLYPCFCTRKDILDEIARADAAPHGAEGAVYPGTCRRLSAAERDERIARSGAYSWRLDSEKAADLIGP